MPGCVTVLNNRVTSAGGGLLGQDHVDAELGELIDEGWRCVGVRDNDVDTVEPREADQVIASQLRGIAQHNYLAGIGHHCRFHSRFLGCLLYTSDAADE